MVKGAAKLRFIFRRQGEKLYADAHAKHNAAIAFMIASLSQGSLDQNELEMLLEQADTSRNAFQKWYDGPARSEGVAACESCGVTVGDLVEIGQLVTDIIQMHNQIAVQQRQEFQQQLRACEWHSWSDLGAGK
jgi:hypothetical protein